MDARRKKLKFRAWHRGFRELDLLLGPFADEHIATLDQHELNMFEHLLEAPDWDTYAWVTGQSEAPTEMRGSVLTLLQSLHAQKS